MMMMISLLKKLGSEKVDLGETFSVHCRRIVEARNHFASKARFMAVYPAPALPALIPLI